MSQHNPQHNTTQRQSAKAAADEAIARVEAAAYQSWIFKARRAVRFLARQNAEFTSEEVWALLAQHNIDPPREPRAMGAVFRTMKAAGVIKSTGIYRAGSRVESHGRPVMVWRSLEGVNK